MAVHTTWTNLWVHWQQSSFPSSSEDSLPKVLLKKIAAVVKRCLVLIGCALAIVATPVLLSIDLVSKLFGLKVRAISVLDFYQGDRNDRGHTLEEIWKFDDEALEAKHDFIQWLFPLKTRGVNPTAPLTDETTQKKFKSTPELQKRLMQSLLVMLKFYGFERRHDGTIVRSGKYSTQIKNWLTPSNHNFLRISRILRSLRLHGLNRTADAFLVVLEEVHKENPAVVGSSLEHWRKA